MNQRLADATGRWQPRAEGTCKLAIGTSSGSRNGNLEAWCLRQQGTRTTFEPPLDDYYDALNDERPNPLNLADPNWCPPAP